MNPSDTISLIFRAVELTGIIVISFVGYRIKIVLAEIRLEQSKVKAELIASQTKLQSELVSNQNQMILDVNEKHHENKEIIVAHMASDEREFVSISKDLTRILNKLDKISIKD